MVKSMLYADDLRRLIATPICDDCMLSAGGFSGSGDLGTPRCVVDEAGNLLYEYDPAYVESR